MFRKKIRGRKREALLPKHVDIYMLNIAVLINKSFTETKKCMY